MATSIITAVTPAARPVDDIATLMEGGAEAALAAANVLLPDRTFRYVVASTWPAGGDGDVLLATYGWTAILFGTDATELSVPAGQGVFSLTYQSVSDSWAVSVTSPAHERFAVLDGDTLVVDEGQPLPFETPDLDPDDWGTAAALWLFGYDPFGRRTDTPVDARVQPLHVLRLG